MRKFALLTACILCALWTGCADETVVTTNQEQVAISLSWWGNDGRNEYTIAGVEEFERLHPEIKVNCSYSEWSGYEARSRAQMVSDTEADVMQINFAWLSEYSSDGTGYYNLDKITNVLDLTTFSEDMLEYGVKNKILNAIPIAMNTETVYINQSIYERYGLEIPKTWDDYFRAAKVMQKDGIYPLSGVAKSMWLSAISYAEQVSGKTLLHEDGTLNFGVEEVQIMIAFYQKLVNEKVVPQVEYFDKISLNNGTYAGGIAWVSDAKNYFDSLIQDGNKIVVAPYPTEKNCPSGKGWYAKPATLYAVSKNTEHPEEAGKLLDFLLNSAEMADLQGIEKGIPLSSSAKEELEKKDMLQGIQYDASQLMEGNGEISPMHPFMENSGVIDLFVECCNQVIFEKATLEEATQQLFDRMQAELS